MALFNKNRNNQALPYVDGLYPAEDIGSPLVSNTTYDLGDGAKGVQYVKSDGTFVLTGGASKANNTAKSGASSSTQQVTDRAFAMDIAQSHHFTVQISGLSMSNLRIASSPLTKNGFLPVKSMNVRYTSYENMSIPVAIFGDFPLLNRKRVSTIDLVCYDRDDNKLEAELRQWEASCFPKGRYVAYMDEIARKFTYKGYTVKGQKTLTYQVFVIPTGNVSVSRDYSANEAKLLNFSVIAVGDGKTCATGNGGDIPVVDHGGDGDGSGGVYHTLYANQVYDANGKPLIR